MAESEKPNLELVGTEDLWQELSRRVHSVLLIFEIEPKPGERELGIWRSGTLPHVLGMAQYAERRLTQMLENWIERCDQEPDDEDHDPPDDDPLRT